jgi:CheY-like chemotaxis protein
MVMSTQDASAAAGAAAPSYRILIVDDNIDVAEPLAMLLEMEGHDPRFETDPRRAIETAAEFGPELVLLDIGLPGMDGYEVAACLREQPRNAGCRIIALSGHGPDGDRERSKAVGIERHLLKPVDIATLMRAVAGDAQR